MTAVRDDDGLWLYHLKSRAQSAELELELASGGRGLAAELADQLREFSVTQRPADATSGLTAPPESIVASQMLDARRRWRIKSYRVGGVLGVVLSLLFLGIGAYRVYGYHVGTPTNWFIGGAVCAVMAIFLFMPERRPRRRAGPARRGRHAGL